MHTPFGDCIFIQILSISVIHRKVGFCVMHIFQTC